MKTILVVVFWNKLLCASRGSTAKKMNEFRMWDKRWQSFQELLVKSLMVQFFVRFFVRLMVPFLFFIFWIFGKPISIYIGVDSLSCTILPVLSTKIVPFSAVLTPAYSKSATNTRELMTKVLSRIEWTRIEWTRNISQFLNFWKFNLPLKNQSQLLFSNLLQFEFYCFVSPFVADKAIFVNGRYMAASEIIILPNRKWRWRLLVVKKSTKQIQRDNTDSMQVKIKTKNEPLLQAFANY